jgi:hypothetical protein
LALFNIIDCIIFVECSENHSVMYEIRNFFLAPQPLGGQGVVVIEDSRSLSDTLHLVELLWTNYQSDLTTINTQKRHTSMSLTGFEPAFPASERPQTHALDRGATGINLTYKLPIEIFPWKISVNFNMFFLYTKLFNIAQNWNYVKSTSAAYEVLSCTKKLLKL